MTDNFKQFRNFMQLPETEGGDAYYVIELVRRGKDCPDLPAANYHFKNYYIDTLQKYDRVQNEIRTLCRTLRLRAYVSVNRKSFRGVTMSTIAEMARCASLNDFRRPYAFFESCSGKYLDKDDKHWVVDIDEVSKSVQDIVVDAYKTFITKCRPEGVKVEMILPTRSGLHFITKPFDRAEFKRMLEAFHYSDPDIKEDHLTLLFEDL